MSTFISTLLHSGTIPSVQPKKMRLPKDIRASLKAVCTRATTHLAGRLKKASSDSTEKFYQDHIFAIFMGLYFETAMAPLLGVLGVYLYSHWMM